MNNFNSLVLYWPFNTNMNESINGYTATLYNNPAISNSVYKVGTGSLDCTSALANVTYTNESGILPSSNTYTFSLWYYPTTKPPLNSFSLIFSFINTDGNNEIGIYTNSSLQVFLVFFNGSSNDSTLQVATLIQNNWNHIGISLTSTSTTINVWLNNSKNSYTLNAVQNLPSVIRTELYINSGINYTIPAYVDDFRVYTTLLTDAEVTTLYNTR